MSKIDKTELIAKLQQLEGLTDEEKSNLIGLLRQHKKYGLVWEDKPEDVEERLREELPVLKEVKERALISDQPDAPNHILIEGDNLEALTALSYTHEGKIDVIYIDPPYNTGNKDFVYNDSYVDTEDSYRHSKWLSFMSKRLRIAKRLLSDKGVIFISIDDNEQANLKLLCDEVFGANNFVAPIIWQKKTGSADANNIAVITEYVFIYSKHIENLSFNKNYNAHDIDRYKYKDEFFDTRGPFYYDSLDRGTLGYHESLDFAITTEVGTTFPNGRNSQRNDGWRWKWGKDKVEWGLKNGFIEVKPNKSKANGLGAYYKIYLNVDNEGELIERATPYKNIISDVLNTHASSELKEIFGTTTIFSNPKPSVLIKHFLYLGSSKSSTLLDFFAGSGTTLHATMQLNADDGGHRQCILVTNNENGICEQVTYERNKRVIQGYTTPKGQAVEGLHNNNLRYYRTEFIPRERTQRNMRALVNAATDLLCVKEDLYQELPVDSLQLSVKLTPKHVRMFGKGSKRMMVIYDERTIPYIVDGLLKETTKNTKVANDINDFSILESFDVENKLKIYVFAPGPYAWDDDFAPVIDRVELCALPEAIYQAYKNVLPKKRNKYADEESTNGVDINDF